MTRGCWRLCGSGDFARRCFRRAVAARRTGCAREEGGELSHVVGFSAAGGRGVGRSAAGSRCCSCGAVSFDTLLVDGTRTDARHRRTVFMTKRACGRRCRRSCCRCGNAGRVIRRGSGRRGSVRSGSCGHGRMRRFAVAAGGLARKDRKDAGEVGSCENVTVGSGCADDASCGWWQARVGEYSGGQLREERAVLCMWATDRGGDRGLGASRAGDGAVIRSSSAAGYCGRGLRGLAGRGRGRGLGVDYLVSPRPKARHSARGFGGHGAGGGRLVDLWAEHRVGGSVLEPA